MAKKCLEDFNPWPPFVDIFSSTILVLLLFMLILIVNLGYYAQFKFKVSYTGTIVTDQLITDEVARHKVKELKELKEFKKKIEEEAKKESKEVIKKSIISTVQEPKEFERAGQDLVQVDDNKTTLQETIQEEFYMVLNFANKEIILNDPTIREVKQFVKKAQDKFPKHKVIVSSVEPQNQISATIAKQIALARTLNTRNLIRKQGYDRSDVRVRKMDENVKVRLPDHESGYVYIYIKVDK